MIGIILIILSYTGRIIGVSYEDYEIILGIDPILLSGIVLWNLSLFTVRLLEISQITTAGDVTPISRVPSRMPSRREAWLFRIAGLTFLALFILTIDWTDHGNYESNSLVAVGVRGFTAIMMAAIVSWAIELHLRLGERVLLQLRGWNRAPFDKWTSTDHKAVTNPADFNRRIPPPADFFRVMPVEEANTYALWAAEKADQRWIQSQILILLGSVTAGMALPILVGLAKSEMPSDSRTPMLLMFGVGILVATLGARISLWTVATWRRRADAYRAHVEARFESR